VTRSASSTPSDLARSPSQFRRLKRRKAALALALTAPLLAFVVVNFLVPIVLVLAKSVDDREIGTILPRTRAALASWDGVDPPPAAAPSALATDLTEAYRTQRLYPAAKRLNSARSGFQALLLKTARQLDEASAGSVPSLPAIDDRWNDPAYWRILKRAGQPLTLTYLLAAFDLTIDDSGALARVPPPQRIFNDIWGRTLWMATVVTALCLLLGYPLAYGLAQLPPKHSNLLMVFVLLPFWTAALVRATAWLVLLQSQGIVNDLGVWLGLWTERVPLIHNRLGVYVTVTHVLLPFMVLPLYAIMRRIPPGYLRAALSLGASPLRVFARVYWPLTLPGVAAGALLTFILAIGFYVIPAIVGGPTDQMVSYYIAFYASESLNWGAATALSTILLIFQAAFFVALNATFGLSRLTMR
jgi:putative spermidine/putrescine transport system permease protein